MMKLTGLCCVMLSVVAAGCFPEPRADPPATPVIDEAAVYTAVIRRQVTIDDTFGGRLAPKVIYVISQTQDRGREVAELPSRRLAPHVRTGIAAGLRDLPGKVTWVSSRDDVPFEGSSRVANDGVIVTLGNLHAQPDGTLRVACSIHIANMAAGMQTYALEQRNGEWVVTGYVGARMIS